MKDEIKEILDNIQEVINDSIKNNYYDLTINRLSLSNIKNKLENYITNLEQKINNQKEEINRLYKQREKFMKKYGYLKEENKSLKELNVCVGCNNNPDYKSRNEKAIEYIEERSDYISSKSGTYYICYAERNIVLDILKGDKDE